MNATSSAQNQAPRLTWISVLFVPALFALAGACGGKSGSGAAFGSTAGGMPGAEAGRQECVADCKYFSSVYDGDLCCRLTEVAQGTGSPADQHCDHANFFQGGPFCPQVVRDTTCSTGTDSGKTCSDFCAAYDDKCSGIGYLGVDDCLFNCKVQSITDGTL